uniref:Transposase n=1 Tax=Eptatretus burgeri TaxID=7764 RepID=A0A8C4QH30_EPTBU
MVEDSSPSSLYLSHTSSRRITLLHRLRDPVRRKRADLWAAVNWQLHHDNAPAHSSHLIQSFLAKHNTPVLRRAPYSPDMAPSSSNIMRNGTDQLRAIPKEAFQRCFRQWQNRWEKCVAAQRDYFEGH